MSTDRRVDRKMCEHTHTHARAHCIFSECYSAVKRKTILPFVTPRVVLEGILLSEMSQTEEDKYRVISRLCGT